MNARNLESVNFVRTQFKTEECEIIQTDMRIFQF